MIQLPIPQTLDYHSCLELVIEESKKANGKVSTIVVSPHPGKYYLVDASLLFSGTEIKTGEVDLLLILDVHRLQELHPPFDVVEAHKVARTAFDIDDKGGKN